MLGLCSILDIMAKENVCLVEFVGGFSGVEENNGKSPNLSENMIEYNYFRYTCNIKIDQVLAF